MKTAVIWGATGTGRSIYSKVANKYNILYFVDGNPEIIGEEYEGLKIQPKEYLCEVRPDRVIIGVLTGYDDAIQWLIQTGEFDEESIICKYVDLSTRARNASLEGVASILSKKAIKGAVAELGVYRGDFAKEINRVFPERELYLFDTFEGFPEQDLYYEVENNLLTNKSGKFKNTSVEYVLSRMPYREKCIVKKGYFPDTAEGMEEKFAFVSIDVDLYKPMLAGLEYFWERMEKNGYIFVHDYFSNAYAGTQKAIEEFAEKYNVSFIPIGDTYSVAFVKC